MRNKCLVCGKKNLKEILSLGRQPFADTFITKSCADTKETIKIDGTEYPLIKREITNTSHPFYTGKMKLVDTAGRIDKFKNRYSKFSK